MPLIETADRKYSASKDEHYECKIYTKNTLTGSILIQEVHAYGNSTGIVTHYGHLIGVALKQANILIYPLQ